MPPTEEIFPEGDEVEIEYAAGGAYATLDGRGRTRRG